MHLHPFQRIRINFTKFLHWVEFYCTGFRSRKTTHLFELSKHCIRFFFSSILRNIKFPTNPQLNHFSASHHTTNRHHHRVVTTKKAETRQLFCYWLCCRWEILLRSVGSSVQRGQTAVVVAVAVAVVVVVVGQYFRVTFHGRRGRCSVPTMDDFVCRVAPFFFFDRLRSSALRLHDFAEKFVTAGEFHLRIQMESLNCCGAILGDAMGA